MTYQPDIPRWWRGKDAPFAAALFLSPAAVAALPSLPGRLGQFRVVVAAVPPAQAIPADAPAAADLVIVEVALDREESVAALAGLLASADGRPVVAAVARPTLEQARILMRAGVTDVVSLPLDRAELERVFALLSDRVGARRAKAPCGRVVSFIKSKGGIGGTTVATQVAAASAAAAPAGRTALLDLDIQLGCAALYLGLLPQLTLGDVIGVADQIDGAALRSATTGHASGLHVLAAPPDTLPLDTLATDQALKIVELAAREFDTTFIDGPLDWTDWSMSVMARSDELVMLTDLSLAGLHNGRRRLDLLQQQGLGDIPLRLIVTRVEKRRFRALSFKDAEAALGRKVDHAVAEDDVCVNDALTQGRLLSDLYPGGRVTRDYQDLATLLTPARAAA